MTTVDDTPAVPPVTDVEPDGSASAESEPYAGRRPGRLVWLGLAAVLVAAAGIGVWLWVADTSNEAASDLPGPAATATVERGTISASESWDGTLDSGTPFTVSGSAQGTVTGLTPQGATVESGDVLFRVDEQPVTVMYGEVPGYRDLGPGAVGADVRQLQANLAELGYDGFRVDGDYTTGTAEAVRAWQEAIGAPPTGAVARGDVAFVPEAGRVEALHTRVGAVVTPGMPVLDITGTDQFANLEVDVEDRDRFDVGAEVTVLLPGSEEVAGSVNTVAVVEAAPQSPEEPMGGGEGVSTEVEPTVQVEVALNRAAPNELVGAPVEVVVATDERTDVLLVPVNALLALAEGGYGLEVVADDGTMSLEPVETGLFAEGKVEIDPESSDIDEGTVVGVAGR